MICHWVNTHILMGHSHGHVKLTITNYKSIKQSNKLPSIFGKYFSNAQG